MNESTVQTFVIYCRAVTVGVGDLIAGVMLGWFPHWRSSTSLVQLSRLGLPWPVIGLLFIGCAWLIVFPPVRVFGYGISSVLFFIGAISLLAVQRHSSTANVLAVVAMFMVAGLLLCGVATAQVDQGRRRDAQ